jgi:hypothetical protein
VQGQRNNPLQYFSESEASFLWAAREAGFQVRRNGKNRPWCFVIVGSLATTVLTTVITVAGNYWLEQRKAKIELAKDVSQRQATALEKLDRDLTSLQGNVLYMCKVAQMPNNSQVLQKQAIDAATVMADIFQDNKPLDDSFQCKHAIHELDESLAPLLAGLSESPTKNLSKLPVYYQTQFIPNLNAAKAALESDHKRVVQALP